MAMQLDARYEVRSALRATAAVGAGSQLARRSAPLGTVGQGDDVAQRRRQERTPRAHAAGHGAQRLDPRLLGRVVGVRWLHRQVARERVQPRRLAEELFTGEWLRVHPHPTMPRTLR